MNKGVLITGHGSRSIDAQNIFKSLVDKFKSRGYKNVVGANMEMASPSISEAVSILNQLDVKLVYVLPLFIYNGIHIKEDIPEILEIEKQKYQDLEFKMADPLLDDDFIVDILEKRLVQAEIS